MSNVPNPNTNVPHFDKDDQVSIDNGGRLIQENILGQRRVIEGAFMDKGSKRLLINKRKPNVDAGGPSTPPTEEQSAVMVRDAAFKQKAAEIVAARGERERQERSRQFAGLKTTTMRIDPATGEAYDTETHVSSTRKKPKSPRPVTARVVSPDELQKESAEHNAARKAEEEARTASNNEYSLRQQANRLAEENSKIFDSSGKPLAESAYESLPKGPLTPAQQRIAQSTTTMSLDQSSTEKSDGTPLWETVMEHNDPQTHYVPEMQDAVKAEKPSTEGTLPEAPYTPSTPASVPPAKNVVSYEEAEQKQKKADRKANRIASARAADAHMYDESGNLKPEYDLDTYDEKGKVKPEFVDQFKDWRQLPTAGRYTTTMKPVYKTHTYEATEDVPETTHLYGKSERDAEGKLTGDYESVKDDSGKIVGTQLQAYTRPAGTIKTTGVGETWISGARGRVNDAFPKADIEPQPAPAKTQDTSRVIPAAALNTFETSPVDDYYEEAKQARLQRENRVANAPIGKKTGRTRAAELNEVAEAATGGRSDYRAAVQLDKTEDFAKRLAEAGKTFSPKNHTPEVVATALDIAKQRGVTYKNDVEMHASPEMTLAYVLHRSRNANTPEVLQKHLAGFGKNKAAELQDLYKRFSLEDQHNRTVKQPSSPEDFFVPKGGTSFVSMADTNAAGHPGAEPERREGVLDAYIPPQAEGEEMEVSLGNKVGWHASREQHPVTGKEVTVWRHHDAPEGSVPIAEITRSMISSGKKRSTITNALNKGRGVNLGDMELQPHPDNPVLKPKKGTRKGHEAIVSNLVAQLTDAQRSGSGETFATDFTATDAEGNVRRVRTPKEQGNKVRNTPVVPSARRFGAPLRQRPDTSLAAAQKMRQDQAYASYADNIAASNDSSQQWTEVKPEDGQK